MTTDDSQAENTADGVFQQVNQQLDDLEREYNQGQGEIAGSRASGDPLQASNDRYELSSQLATLQAEVSRQRDELDERDRMLGELGDKIAGFESDIAQRDQMIAELHAARQNVLDERREQARLSALLDARAAEREELAAVAQRFQNERDHVQELLDQSLARYEEAEIAQAELDDRVRHLEAARDTASHEHESRAHELVESRAEMIRLSDRLEELTRSNADANERAEKNDALAERRANESGYLNRRIEALNEKLTEAQAEAAHVSAARQELVMAERRISELERDLASERSESAAARAAVDALADRTSDYDELTERIAQLTGERDAAWEAASGYSAAPVPVEASPATADAAVEDSLAHAARDLVERARELSGRRANEVEAAAVEAEAKRHADALIRAEEQALAEAAARIEHSPPAEPEPVWADTADTPAADTADTPHASVPTTSEIPLIEVPGSPPPESEIPQIDISGFEADGSETDLSDLPPPPQSPQSPQPEVVELGEIEVDPQDLPQAADEPDVSIVPDLVGTRKRAILPTELVPNTPEAVSFLFGQPGVIAIIDARSTCGRTGIRPSDLFNRVAQLRDRFDVPIEVVVTPVSTPVGGAPELSAIGVHSVTGADTVADRIRALCMGFPADQPLVVVAGDDHVRRAAIGEEANVLEPAAVMSLTGS